MLDLKIFASLFMARKLKAKVFEFENALEFGNFFETFLCCFLGRFKK